MNSQSEKEGHLTVPLSDNYASKPNKNLRTASKRLKTILKHPETAVKLYQWPNVISRAHKA